VKLSFVAMLVISKAQIQEVCVSIGYPNVLLDTYSTRLLRTRGFLLERESLLKEISYPKELVTVKLNLKGFKSHPLKNV